MNSLEKQLTNVLGWEVIKEIPFTCRREFTTITKAVGNMYDIEIKKKYSPTGGYLFYQESALFTTLKQFDPVFERIRNVETTLYYLTRNNFK